MHVETVQPCSGGSLSVLVVEDEFLLAMEVETMLEESGHTVLGPAASIEEALCLLEDTRPDVAVLDLNVRGQLAIPVAERLRNLHVPFVLASAYTSLDFDGSGCLADVENVGKPTSERHLLEALGRATQQPA